MLKAERLSAQDVTFDEAGAARVVGHDHPVQG